MGPEWRADLRRRHARRDRIWLRRLPLVTDGFLVHLWRRTAPRLRCAEPVASRGWRVTPRRDRRVDAAADTADPAARLDRKRPRERRSSRTEDESDRARAIASNRCHGLLRDTRGVRWGFCGRIPSATGHRAVRVVGRS